MRKNIVISATRQWNPGDEFIMFGVMNILDELGMKYNPILFNRSPEIRDGRKYSSLLKTKQYAEKIEGKHLLRIFKGGFRDNSYKNGTDSSVADAVIFAGSPEWYGYRVKVLYELIQERKIPYIFLGIGMGDSRNFQKIENMYYDVLKKCPLITARDHKTVQMVSKLNKNTHYLACPAILASKNSKTVKKVEKIALIYATHKTLCGNKISKETHDFLIKLYQKIIKKFPGQTELVCHYIDEIEEAKKEFPECNIFYSFDARDYTDIYNHFDFVIGSRVHGIGMCASLGIPGVMISHDIRSETVLGFKAAVCNYKNAGFDSVVNTILEEIEKVSVNSENLVQHKKSVMDEYKHFLKPVFGNEFYKY